MEGKNKKNFRWPFSFLSLSLIFCLFVQLLDKEKAWKNPTRALKEYGITQEKIDDFYDNFPEEENYLSSSSREILEKMGNIGEKEDKYVKLLGIDRDTLHLAYVSEQKEVAHHKHHTFYDEKTDSIKWELVAEQIYKNSLKKEKESFFFSSKKKALTKVSIDEKVNEMKAFFEKLKQDFPQYDLEKLACVLEDFALVDAGSSPNAIAATSVEEIMYYDLDEIQHKYSPSQLQHIDSHEFFHLGCINCSDIRNQDTFYQNFHSIHQYIPSKFQVSSYSFDFLEEIYADIYAGEFCLDGQFCYYDYDEILNILQFICALRDEYEMDDILKHLLYNDTLSFLKDFSLYQDREESLLEVMQMLKSFDVIFDSSATYCAELENCGLEEESDAAFQSLYERSTLSLSKMFYRNMIVFNERHKDEVSFELNLQLLNLYDKLLSYAKWSLDYQPVVPYLSTDETSEEQQLRSLFFDYLSIKYEKEKEQIVESYQQSEIILDYEFPTFMGEEKQQYYQEFQKVYSKPYSIATPYFQKIGKDS